MEKPLEYTFRVVIWAAGSAGQEQARLRRARLGAVFGADFDESGLRPYGSLNCETQS